MVVARGDHKYKFYFLANLVIWSLSLHYYRTWFQSEFYAKIKPRTQIVISLTLFRKQAFVWWNHSKFDCWIAFWFPMPLSFLFFHSFTNRQPKEMRTSRGCNFHYSLFRCHFFFLFFFAFFFWLFRILSALRYRSWYYCFWELISIIDSRPRLINQAFGEHLT